MANEPRIEITGNVGKNAEHKTSGGGRDYIKFSVAQTPATKQADGTYLDGDTFWFDVTSFDNTLDAIDFVKGTKVKIQGRLTQRTHEGKLYLGVVADTLEIIPRENQPRNIPNNWKAAVVAPTHVPDDMPF